VKSVLELSEYLFMLFALVNVHKPAKIEAEFTFRQITNIDQKTKIIKILNALSVDVITRKEG